VILTATDNHGASNQCTATVTVVDNTPPGIGACPPGQTVNATSRAGAVVTFATPIATDNCSVASINCLPISGSIFPIGTTTVTCTAMDGSGNTATCSFAVKVRSSTEQLTDLIALVQSLSIEAGVKNALIVKLRAALAALNASDSPTDCARLQDFINLVNAQTGKKLTAASSNCVAWAAMRIRAVLGC
jgi:hypothetical protein